MGCGLDPERVEIVGRVQAGASTGRATQLPKKAKKKIGS